MKSVIEGIAELPHREAVDEHGHLTIDGDADDALALTISGDVIDQTRFNLDHDQVEQLVKVLQSWLARPKTPPKDDRPSSPIAYNRIKHN